MTNQTPESRSRELAAKATPGPTERTIQDKLREAGEVRYRKAATGYPTVWTNEENVIVQKSLLREAASALDAAEARIAETQSLLDWNVAEADQQAILASRLIERLNAAEARLEAQGRVVEAARLAASGLDGEIE